MNRATQDRNGWWWVGEDKLVNVHSPQQCAGEACVIHNPSRHAMSEFPLVWRDDRGIFERLCPCGIGHPDPDQRPYWQRTGQIVEQVHGCCGVHCA